MNLNTTRLVLRYDPGQFTFSRFDRTASDEVIFDLAQQINQFQEDDAQVVKVQVFAIN